MFGPGWVVGDCLWPVVCVVEKLTGSAAVQRSRELMTGLRSAGRALAIRHLALAAFAIAEAVKSIGFLFQRGSGESTNVVLTATWFPIFALFAARRCFFTTGRRLNESGPLAAVGSDAGGSNHRAAVFGEFDDLAGGWS